MTLTEHEIGAFVATLARSGALVGTAPVIGDSGIPMRPRLIFALAIAFAVGVNRAGVSYADLPMTALLEMAVGMMTGLTARFVVQRAAVAGQLMGLSLGFGFASQYDVHAGESAGTLRTLLMTLAGIAFLSIGGLESLVRSCAQPPAHVGHLALLGPELLREGTSAFAHGLALAAPIVLAALVGNLGLAVINRAAPAVNVFSISLAGVLILGGIVLLATSANLIAGLVDTARNASGILRG